MYVKKNSYLHKLTPHFEVKINVKYVKKNSHLYELSSLHQGALSVKFKYYNI